jgi:hypothetical protein
MVNIKQLKGVISGSLLFVSDNLNINENNANLYWDNDNYMLSIGHNLPSSTLHIKGIGNTSSTTVFRIDSSTVNNIFTIKNDGSLFGSNGYKFSVQGAFLDPYDVLTINDSGTVIAFKSGNNGVAGQIISFEASNTDIRLISNGGVNPALSFYINNGSSLIGNIGGNNGAMKFSSLYGIWVESPIISSNSWTNPQAQLHVKGIGSSNSTIAFRVDSSTINEMFNIRDDGRISINSPWYDAMVTIRPRVDVNSMVVYNSSDLSSFVINNNGGVNIGVGSGIVVTDQQRVTIGGNIGSHSNPLSIYGKSTDGDIVAIMKSGVNNGIYIQANRIYGQNNSYSTTIVLHTEGTSYFNGGSLAVGRVSANARLHVQGEGSSSDTVSLTVDTTTINDVFRVRDDARVFVGVDALVVNTSDKSITLGVQSNSAPRFAITNQFDDRALMGVYNTSGVMSWSFGIESGNNLGFFNTNTSTWPLIINGSNKITLDRISILNVVQDDNANQVLVRDSLTGEIMYRSASTLGSGGVGGVNSLSELLVLGNQTNGENIIFTNGSYISNLNSDYELKFDDGFLITNQNDSVRVDINYINNKIDLISDQISLTGDVVLEGTFRLYQIGDMTGRVLMSNSIGLGTWQQLTTSNVNEGINLYHTVLRVRNTDLTGYVVGTNTILTTTDTILGAFGKVQAQLNSKQETLISGTNIKTINGTSVLGSGDIVISGGSGGVGKYSTSIGNGSLTAFTITHNLNTQNLDVVVRETSGDLEKVYPKIQFSTVNTVTVTFSGITPSSNQFTVTCIG